MKNTLHRVLLLVSLMTIGLVSFASAAAAAQTVAPDDGSILDLLDPVYQAFAGGHYAYAASLGVILMVAVAKRYLGDKWPWMHTNAGNCVLALLAATATSLSVTLAHPTATVTLPLLESSLLVGVGAAGGWLAIKSLLIEPLVAPLAARAPAWVKTLLGMVTWVFEEPTAPTAPSPATPAPTTPSVPPA